jgi:hypothetical protein
MNFLRRSVRITAAEGKRAAGISDGPAFAFHQELLLEDRNNRIDIALRDSEIEIQLVADVR